MLEIWIDILEIEIWRWGGKKLANFCLSRSQRASTLLNPVGSGFNTGFFLTVNSSHTDSSLVWLAYSKHGANGHGIANSQFEWKIVNYVERVEWMIWLIYLCRLCWKMDNGSLVRETQSPLAEIFKRPFDPLIRTIESWNSNDRMFIIVI